MSCIEEGCVPVRVAASVRGACRWVEGFGSGGVHTTLREGHATAHARGTVVGGLAFFWCDLTYRSR